MNEELRLQFGSLFRSLAIAAGGIAVGKGWISKEIMQEVVNNAVPLLVIGVSGAWGWVAKKGLTKAEGAA